MNEQQINQCGCESEECQVTLVTVEEPGGLVKALTETLTFIRWMVKGEL